MPFSPLMLINDLKTFFPMIWAIFRGRYKMPWGTLVWGIICFVYLISPVDALPDVWPLLGITDDAAFVLWVYAKLHQDLTHFRALQHTEKTTILEAEIISKQNQQK